MVKTEGKPSLPSKTKNKTGSGSQTNGKTKATAEVQSTTTGAFTNITNKEGPMMPATTSAKDMSRVRVCSTGELLDAQMSVLREMPIARGNPMVLAYHDEPIESKGAGALSLVFGDFSLVVALDRIPVERLKDFFHLSASKSDFFVIVDGAVAAVMGCARVTLPHDQLYNLQLGHELLYETCGAGLATSASRLAVVGKNVGHALNDGNIGTLRSLWSGAKDGRAVFLAMYQRLKNKAKLWRKISAEAAQEIAEEYYVPFTYKNMPIAQRVITFDGVDFTAGTSALSQDDDVVKTASSIDDAGENLTKMLEVLPDAWRDSVDSELAPLLVDLQLDMGRAPVAHFRDTSRRILSDGPEDVVTNEDLQMTLDAVVDGFDEDNRGGIAGSLHRVSVLKGRSGNPIGATLRIGRHVHNAAAILFDVLRAKEYDEASILVVGPPAAGKTTMVRDAARILAENSRVMIVDSSDEIGGPGIVPHESIGDARRMSVIGGKRRLSFALLEAVENHTPDVLVADELSNRSEVAGVITARQRGVRVVASAHGSLRSVVRNPVLRPLLGGLDRVVISDASCKYKISGKVRNVRSEQTVFDVVVEMGVYPNVPSAIRVVHDVHTAVDAVLEGNPFTCDTRWRGLNDCILSATVHHA